MSAVADANRGDFTANPRVLVVTLMAVFIGVASAFVALSLTKLISFFTNLFYYQRIAVGEFTSPAGHHLGVWSVLIPIVGGLIIGLMARYGSEKIRGHGIPEALEAILIGRSRMEARVAVLKPLSSALSIGTGGPFGAEGPIIMTGGAFGSLFAQGFHMSAAERKTLLVAGAAGGMSAIFATPVAAVLLAVELLLFEWKPRSFIPVASAAAVAAALRVPLMGVGIGNVGRRTGAPDDHGRRARRARRSLATGGRSRRLGGARHGRDAGRDDAGTLHRDRVHARGDPRRQPAARDVGGVRRRGCG